MHGQKLQMFVGCVENYHLLFVFAKNLDQSLHSMSAHVMASYVHELRTQGFQDLKPLLQTD